MELFSHKLEGKWEDIQRIQDLVPLHHLSLNRSLCGLRRCLIRVVRYRDEEFPLEEMILLNTWDIIGPKD
jgi:hypothetical protein